MQPYYERRTRHSAVGEDIVGLNRALTRGSVTPDQATNSFYRLRNSWNGSIGQFSGQNVEIYAGYADVRDVEQIDGGEYRKKPGHHYYRFVDFHFRGVLQPELEVETMAVSSRDVYWYVGPVVVAHVIWHKNQFSVPVSGPVEHTGIFAQLTEA